MDKKIKYPKKEQQIAYHEAGHAVIAFLKKIPFRSVSVEHGPGREGVIDFDEKMLAETESDNILTDENRSRIEDTIIFALAGDVAESMFIGNGKLLDQLADELLAKSFILYLNLKSLEECNECLSRMQEEAKSLLSQPSNWSMVEALAQALLKDRTLDFQQTLSIIQEAGKNLS